MVFRGDEVIKIDEVEYQMLAKTFVSSAFSGHADISQIYDVFGELTSIQVINVHINYYDKDNLIDSYKSHFKSSNIIVPKLTEQYLLYQQY